MTVAILWILCEMNAPWWVVMVTVLFTAVKWTTAIVQGVREAREEE